MAPSRQILKMLYVGQDTDFRNDLKKGMTALSMQWKVLSCCPTRIAAPEVKIRTYDIIVVHWKSAFRQLSQDGAPASRSPQGVVHAILEQVNVAEVKKIVVIGDSFSREATIFLAESEVTRIFRSAAVRSHEDSLMDVKSFLVRCITWQKENSEYFQSDEARTLRRFHRVMTEWEKCSDQERMRTMEEVLNVFGDSAKFADMRAQKCMKEGEYGNAEAWLQKALEMNPNFLKALSHLAQLHMELGRYEAALAIYERLQANCSQNPARYLKMGICYTKLKKYEKAKDILGKSLALDTFNDQAREEMGITHCALGEFEEAHGYLKNSRNGKKIAKFLNEIGIGYVSKGQFDKAVEHYKKAQFVLPGNELSHLLFYNLALAYAKWKKYEFARRYANLALIKKPGYEKAARLVKQIADRMGGTEQAA